MPPYITIPRFVIADWQLSSDTFQTLVMLYSLTWQTEGECTLPMTLEELAFLCNLDKHTLFAELIDLRDAGFIRCEDAENERAIIYPLRWEPANELPREETPMSNEEEAAWMHLLTNDEAETSLSICHLCV